MMTTWREFLQQVVAVGGYRAGCLTLQAFGLVGLPSAAAAEPFDLQPGAAQRCGWKSGRVQCPFS